MWVGVTGVNWAAASAVERGEPRVVGSAVAWAAMWAGEMGVNLVGGSADETAAMKAV